MLTPASGGSGFGLNLRGIDVAARLGLYHQNGCIGFGHEVGDVLWLLGAELVIDLELPLGGLEPLAGVALQNDCKAALR